MRRRVFLRSVAAGSAALTAATLAACGQAPQTPVQQATTAPAQ